MPYGGEPMAQGGGEGGYPPAAGWPGASEQGGMPMGMGNHPYAQGMAAPPAGWGRQQIPWQARQMGRHQQMVDLLTRIEAHLARIEALLAAEREPAESQP